MRTNLLQRNKYTGKAADSKIAHLPQARVSTEGHAYFLRFLQSEPARTSAGDVIRRALVTIGALPVEEIE